MVELAAAASLTLRLGDQRYVIWRHSSETLGTRGFAVSLHQRLCQQALSCTGAVVVFLPVILLTFPRGNGGEEVGMENSDCQTDGKPQRP